MTLTAGSLFSGMGGFASGLRAAGFELRWANDNDAHACAAFRLRFPGMPVLEKDVKDLSVADDDLTPVDVLAAAFP
ncbi:MAG: DNA cytosine methyltransferase, partial [Chloroflexota bacterium]|nr:DNA cytosine methyltransferase [Chloroflexota bacterium]